VTDDRLKKLRRLGVRWDALKDQRKCLKRDLDQAMEGGDVDRYNELDDELDKNLEKEEDVCRQMLALRNAIDGK